MTAAERRRLERPVLRAAVRWTMHYDMARELAKQIGDVAHHPLLGKYNGALGAAERAERTCRSAARRLGRGLGYLP